MIDIEQDLKCLLGQSLGTHVFKLMSSALRGGGADIGTGCIEPDFQLRLSQARAAVNAVVIDLRLARGFPDTDIDQDCELIVRRLFARAKKVGRAASLPADTTVNASAFFTELYKCGIFRGLIRQSRLRADQVLQPTDLPSIRSSFTKLGAGEVVTEAESLSAAYVATAKAIAKRTWTSSTLTEIAAWQCGLAERATEGPTAAVVIEPPRTKVRDEGEARGGEPEGRDGLAVATSLKSGSPIDGDEYVALFLDGPWRLLELRGSWWAYPGSNARTDGELRVRRIATRVKPPQIVVQYSTGFGGGCRVRVIDCGNPEALLGPKGRRLVADRLHWAHWQLLSAHQIECYLEDISKELPPPVEVNESQVNVMALTPYEAAFVKQNLELQFAKKALKPGDEGFVADKRVEVPEEKVQSAWDDEESD